MLHDRDHKYIALKICIRNYPSIPREKVAFERLRPLDFPWIQKHLDTFSVEGLEGAVHQCFVLEPLSMNLAILGENLKGWDRDPVLFRLTVLMIFETLNFIHTRANLIHCGKSNMTRYLITVNPPHN